MAAPNLEVVLRAKPADYADEITRRGEPYDVVAVPGVERLATATRAIDALSGEGVIVWDNSEEEVFRTARREVAGLGDFRELRFTGFGPVCTWTWSTSILYRPRNCLGI